MGFKVIGWLQMVFIVCIVVSVGYFFLRHMKRKVSKIVLLFAICTKYDTFRLRLVTDNNTKTVIEECCCIEVLVNLKFII